MEDEQFKALSESIEGLRVAVEGPLRAMALTSMVDAFYTKDERDTLLFSIGELSTKTGDAYAAHEKQKRKRRDMDDTGIGMDQFLAEKNRLWAVAEEYNGQLQFKRLEHPLIFELVKARDALCTTP